MTARESSRFGCIMMSGLCSICMCRTHARFAKRFALQLHTDTHMHTIQIKRNAMSGDRRAKMVNNVPRLPLKRFLAELSTALTSTNTVVGHFSFSLCAQFISICMSVLSFQHMVETNKHYLRKEPCKPASPETNFDCNLHGKYDTLRH